VVILVQVASLFNQLLQHFPRTEFASLVKKHAAERDAKGFTCWTQFVSMLFCQLGRADSLREICNGLGCCLWGDWYMWGFVRRQLFLWLGDNYFSRSTTITL
jgi:hypothetical protein